jgi:hypothetical protein
MPVTQSGATAVAMVVAFAIQQLNETVDAVASAFWDLDKDPKAPSRRKAILKVVSIILGAIAAAGGIDVLADPEVAKGFHGLITAVALAGGTEGVNSVLKYMGYSKEAKKNDAAAKLNPPSDQMLQTIGRK